MTPHSYPYRARRPATVAGILRRSGFPVDTGNVPYAIESDSFLIKVDHQAQAGTRSWCFATTTPAVSTRTSSRGAGSWPGAAAPPSTARTTCSRLRNCGVSIELGQRGKISVCSSGSAGAIRWIRIAAVPVPPRTRAGRPLEILGVASVGRQRFTPQPRLNNRYQVARHAQPVARQSPGEGRGRLQLCRPQAPGIAAAFRRQVFVRAGAGHSGLAAGRGERYPGARAGHSSAPTFRGTATHRPATVISDVSFFAQDDWRATNNLTVKFGLRYQNQFWPDTVHHMPGLPDGVFVSEATTTTSRRGWRCRGIRPAAGRRLCMPHTGCTTTTPSPAPPAFSTPSTVRQPACVRSSRDSERQDCH